MTSGIGFNARSLRGSEESPEIENGTPSSKIVSAQQGPETVSQ